MKRLLKDGFTLVELLVVVAVIALLLFILIPAVTPPRPSHMMYCLANNNGLIKSWYFYHEENEGKLVQGYCPVESDNMDKWQDSWVLTPMDFNGDFVWVGSTRENKHEGINKGNLFEYMEYEKYYHCPADKRYLKNKTGAYRSYSIVAQMNGKYDHNNGGKVYTKFNEIRAPSEKIVFMEETAEKDKDGNVIEYNKGSWQLDISGQNPDWKSPISINHKKYLIASFADGHVEKYTIQDDRTKKFAENPWAVQAGQAGNEDLAYFYKNTAQNRN